MTFDLENKNILITGASSGIGEQCAIQIGQSAHSSFILGRNQDRLSSVCKRSGIEEENCLVGDLRDDLFLNDVVDILPALDGLVLCAGVVDYIPAKSISRKRIESIFEVNFYSNVLLIQKLLRKKKLNRGASIIFISSISSLSAVGGTAIYAASKAAVNAYGRVLATELSPQGIRVNMILPGIVRTKLIEQSDLLSQDNIDEQERTYPLGYGSSKDVANQVCYLLSDLSSWVTGTDIIIDGGYLLKK